MSRAVIWIWSLALLGGFGWGCAGYRVGPTNGVPAGSRSVQVHPFLNKTREPRLTDAVTGALRKQLQKDGTYRLETRGPGDIVVTGFISKFDRSGVTFQPRDVQTVRDFSMAIVAVVSAQDRGTGKFLFENQEVEGRTTLRVGADLSSAERQAVPLMAEELARRVTSLIAEGTW